MRRPNDVGGTAAGPVDPGSHETKRWQKELTAVLGVLGPGNRHVLWVDEFRRAREDIPEDVYNGLTYFELWAQGAANLLVEKGLLTHDEIDQRMETIRRRGA